MASGFETIVSKRIAVGLGCEIGTTISDPRERSLVSELRPDGPFDSVVNPTFVDVLHRSRRWYPDRGFCVPEQRPAVESSNVSSISSDRGTLMEIPDQLRCLFTAQLEQRGGSVVIDVPEQELDLGDVDREETYRVAILPSDADNERTAAETEARTEELEQPPVEEGEQRTVEIDDIGDQGDGITRVERGFVVIVPDTDTGERVTIEITDVRETVAFAEVVKRVSYYE